ncbi:hypothetical protein BH23ACT9_BH23ACT9_33250 [soil metagenome]
MDTARGRSALAVAAVAALLLAGCAGGPFGDQPIPTVPEAAPRPVPTLDQLLTPAPGPRTPPPPPPAPSGVPAAATPDPLAPADPPSDAAGVPAPPSDPAAIARDLGLQGLLDLLASDPDAIGDRGQQLVRDLERIADRPGDRNRIRQLQDRLDDWLQEDRIDPQVGEVVALVLDQALADAGGDGDDDDDD